MAKLSSLVVTYKNRLNSVNRNACGELAARVVRRTPVDTGVLRKSWTPSIGEPDYSNRGGDFAAVAQSLQPGQTFSLGNGQPYARIIEYGAHSPQAPSGMMRISLAEWPQIVEAAARGV